VQKTKGNQQATVACMMGSLCLDNADRDKEANITTSRQQAIHQQAISPYFKLDPKNEDF